MATTKRNKGGRATARRAKSTARPAKSAKATPKAKVVAKAKTKPVAKAKPVTKAKPTSTRAAQTKAARPLAKPARVAGVENPELVALKAKFQRERNGLEKRLTEAVREIGLLRHHEMRSTHFERQVAERDATIERLQAQLTELKRRPADPVYVHEVQQSLALSAPAHQEGAGNADAHVDLDGASADLDHAEVDLDEFEDDRLADDADLVNDDD